jgi:hypothetical protein
LTATRPVLSTVTRAAGVKTRRAVVAALFKGPNMTNLEIIEMAALRLGCERALELLENPDASHFDADKVIAFLTIVLDKSK